MSLQRKYYRFGMTKGNPMKRFLITALVIAAGLALLFAILSPSLKASLQSSPQSPETATPTPNMPASEVQRRGVNKCIDGSALTVTTRDSTQTSYRCESGAVGAYTN